MSTLKLKILATLMLVNLSTLLFSQTEVKEANTIIDDLLSKDVALFSAHLKKSEPVNFAVNDCKNELDYTPVSEYTDPKELLKAIFTVVGEELGDEGYTLTWAECVDFPYYNDTPIAIVFILAKSSGQRIKINIFCKKSYAIGDVTIYRNSCTHF